MEALTNAVLQITTTVLAQRPRGCGRGTAGLRPVAAWAWSRAWLSAWPGAGFSDDGRSSEAWSGLEVRAIGGLHPESGGVCVAPKYVGFENRELEVAVFARERELEERARESDCALVERTRVRKGSKSLRVMRGIRNRAAAPP